jgi:hypothetical protein
MRQRLRRLLVNWLSRSGARPRSNDDESPSNPGSQLPAKLAGLAANLPSKLQPQVLDAQLHEPAKASGVPHKIPQAISSEGMVAEA